MNNYVELFFYNYSEDSVQKELYELHKITQEYVMKISAEKTKIVAFQDVHPVKKLYFTASTGS